MTKKNKTNKAQINSKQTARSKRSKVGIDLALGANTGIKTKANNVARCKADYGERKVMPFVLDMLYYKTPLLLNSDSVGGSEVGQSDVTVDTPTALILQKTLSKAAKRSEKKKSGKTSKKPKISFTAELPLPNDSRTVIRMRYIANVIETTDPEATKNFAIYKIHMTPITEGQNATLITVNLSRDDVENPKGYIVGIQVNPSTLLSGQNAWLLPMMCETMREDLALQLGFPAIVLTALLKKIEPNFKASTALADHFLNGRALMENIQFAIYADVTAEYKQIVLALLEAAYQTRHVSVSGGKFRTHVIGKWCLLAELSG